MQCIKCNKIFNSNRDLQRHLDRKIKCDRVLECDNCKKKFKTIQNLNKHLNNKKKCEKLDPEIENVILKLEKEVLELKIENIELKQINNINNGTINSTINNNINNGTINNINIFGNESLDHITRQILEKEILNA